MMLKRLNFNDFSPKLQGRYDTAENEQCSVYPRMTGIQANVKGGNHPRQMLGDDCS